MRYIFSLLFFSVLFSSVLFGFFLFKYLVSPNWFHPQLKDPNLQFQECAVMSAILYRFPKAIFAFFIHFQIYSFLST